VSGFPSSRFFQFPAANGLNSSRVFSGCSSRLCFASLPISSAQGVRHATLQKAHHEIVSKPHDDHVMTSHLPLELNTHRRLRAYRVLCSQSTLRKPQATYEAATWYSL
jgi:hypothetical protein